MPASERTPTTGRPTAEHQVVIAGGGPTGLVLAAELTRADVDVVIVERRATQALDGSRAGGLHARTMEELDQRGIVERFTAEGQLHPATGFAMIPLDLGDAPSRHNHVLALWQAEIERILADHVLGELGVPIIRERDVVGLTQDAAGVDVGVSDGTSLRAAYLVGCDGGRSTVRRAAGIEFVGLDPSTSWMIAEVEFDGEPELGVRRDDRGQHVIGQRQPDEPIRLVLTEAAVDHDGEPTLDDLRQALVEVYGSDFGLRRATWISRFTDAARQATTYRRGRVLLAGDAAHVHPPQGGQGLNTGVQDAMNLGWKLAQVVHGTSPDGLLDTYHAERHPVGARVLHNTMAQVALAGPDDRHQALRDTMADLLAMDQPRRHLAAMLTGLDIRYDLGEGHPLVGRRMPDLDLRTPDGPTRVAVLLRRAKHVLLDLGRPAAGTADAGAWADRVEVVRATCDGPWELPVVGAVPEPAAVLIRPDGYVAWAGDPGPAGAGLREALATWAGSPSP